ncbi:TPA: hypothetical protein I8235_003227 [Kluyvera intermedia]|nr:hypothetical protein [Kluyvera intermedia]
MTNEQIQEFKAAADNLATAEERYDRAEITIREYISVNDQYHNFVKDHANILSLLAERDADKALIAEQAKQIDELEDKQRETLRQARSFREAHESAAEIIRRYESKTIKLTLPTTRLWAGQVDCYEAKEILIAVRAACAAAGITLVVRE